MKSLSIYASLLIAGVFSLHAQFPDNLVVEGVPPIPAELKKDAGRYLEFRAAAFNDWHPKRREMLIVTRFGDAAQLHLVKNPGGARRQLTFLPEPISGGSFDPIAGQFMIFAQDTGGAEAYQFYRYDFDNGDITLLTDGKSRNMTPAWSKDGRFLAYNSTRRNGRDLDVYIMNPRKPGADKLLAQLTGGGWSVMDWSPDGSKLLLGESISINESYVYLCDTETGKLRLLTPKDGQKISWRGGEFAADGKSFFIRSDKGSEYLRLSRFDLESGIVTTISGKFKGDVETFDLSPEGNTIAYTVNESGAESLHLLDVKTSRKIGTPKLPMGVLSGLKWHANSRDLGYSLTSAKSPNDAYSLNVESGEISRWTESETGGLNPQKFVEPELVRIKSFDGQEISGFLYRPDVRKFRGPRPVLVQIHGGPESQSRPIFQARNNYFINELGVAVFLPNVRGSAGFGKTFLTLDNGFKREDTVKDIGAFLDWLGRDRDIDKNRIAVTGGSYGGYMSLACMVHFSDRLRCGIDIVGISNFKTFMKNTSDYRRDLRRVEYGDERDAAMAQFFDKISPGNHADKIKKPLFVIQGLNDPRVPASESQQMVKAIRDRGGQVWFLMAKDEGHGFHKKNNVDVQFQATVQFLKSHLLN